MQSSETRTNKSEPVSENKKWATSNTTNHDMDKSKPPPIPEVKMDFKYKEEEILIDLHAHLRSTYDEHYIAENGVECFDAWIALGEAGPTFRNTAIKYLWRYGKKGGKDKNDLMKAMHYIQMYLYVEHYKDEN